MNKLLALFAFMLSFLTANAITYSVGEPNNNVNDGDTYYYDSGTKTIHFYDVWDYRPGWWLADQDNTGQNLSAYDEFVLEFEGSVNFKIQAVMEYVNGSSSYADNGGSSNRIVIPLSENYKDKVKQIYIQCVDYNGVGQSVKFSDAYFQGDVWTTFNVSTPGSLPTLIPSDQKDNITRLRLTGNLDGTDILYIREMAGIDYNGNTTTGKLNALDLSGANIVSGGDAYYYNGQNYNTSDNTIGEYMFFYCRLSTLILPNSVTRIESYGISFLNNLTHLIIGSGVKSIGQYGLSNNYQLTSLVLPDNIITLGDYALVDNYQLTKLTLSSNLESIGEGAFYYCSSLSEIQLPKTITQIGENAFYSCKALTSIKLPNSLTQLNDGLLHNCNKLVSVTLPNALETIGNSVFSGCSKLETINLPTTLQSIGENAFRDCIVLSSISIPDGVTAIGNEVFSGCYSLKTVHLPSSLTSIPNSLFYGCTSITGIDIPESVNEIGTYAFENCTSLTKITLPTNLSKISSGTFQDCESLSSIILPNSISVIGDFAFSGCSSLKEILIPSSISSIGYAAFQACTALETIILEEGVQEIGSNAFYNCSSIKQITIPSTVNSFGYGMIQSCKNLVSVKILCPMESVPDDMFSNCVKLTEVILPSGLTTIGYGAFNNCASLKEFVIPSTVITICDGAFQGCISLTKMSIPESVTQISSFLFSGCTSLKEITLPATLTYIDYYAFSGCESLESVSIPKNVTAINYCAFSGCKSLKTFEWPSNITEISESMFSDCTSLQTVILPDGLTTIGSSVFYGCKALKQINLPESISDLQYSVFQESGITSIKIPSKITHLRSCLFYLCDSLRSIVLPDSLISIEYGAFYGCTSLNTIYLPATITEIESRAFSGCISLNEIHARPLSPATIQYNTFYEVNKTTCTLFVPDGCLAAYRSADYWNEFINMEEESATSDGVPLSATDWKILKKFYSEMATEGWTNKWIFADTPEATGVLKGVTTQNGHVISITLPKNNMSGTMSPAIWELPELSKLDLSGNKLEADLGQQVDNFLNKNTSYATKLTYLDISNNLFKGNIGKIGLICPLLTTLKAGHCHISEVIPALSPDITTLDINHQIIDKEIEYDSLISSRNLSDILPSILYYNPTSQSYDNYAYIVLLDSIPNNNWAARMYIEDGANWYSYTGWYSSYYYYTADYSGYYYFYSGNNYDYSRPSGYLLYAGTTDGSRAHTFRVRLNFKQGDSNLDGAVNVADLQHIINRALEQYVQVFNFTAANIIKDNDINVQDVVGMVNLMMSEDISTVAAGRQRSSSSSGIANDAKARVYTDNGSLILDSDVPVAAFDIVVASQDTDKMNWLLTNAGFVCKTSTKGNLTRIIGYSISGGELPAGHTVIASGNLSDVISAQCANKAAQVVKTSINQVPTGISSQHYDFDITIANGGLKFENSTSLRNVKWSVFSLSGQKLDEGFIPELVPGSSIIPAQTGDQSIIRVTIDNKTITKKLSSK